LSLDLLTSDENIDRSFNLFSTTSEDITVISDSQFLSFKKYLIDDSDVQDDELKSQVSNVRFDSFPSDSWTLSTPKKEQLIQILQNSLKAEAKDHSNGKI
jgi:hypothetical protein